MLQIKASIAKHQDRIWCAYQTKHLRHYNTECCLTELDAGFEPIAEKRLSPQNNNTAFEGIKLISAGSKLLAFYNYLPFDESSGWQQKYGVGYGEVDTLTGFITNQTSLRKYANKQHEKNWIPYIWNDELYVLTDLTPFIRGVKISGNGRGEVFCTQLQIPEWDFGQLTGGTPLISSPEDINWLYGFAYSICVDDSGFKRRYYHTVVRFDHVNKVFEYYPSPLEYNDDETDEEYQVLWQFSNGKHHKGVVPAGISAHGDGVIVSFGKDDVLSYTEYYSWERLKGYFN